MSSWDQPESDTSREQGAQAEVERPGYSPYRSGQLHLMDAMDAPPRAARPPKMGIRSSAVQQLVQLLLVLLHGQLVRHEAALQSFQWRFPGWLEVLDRG